MARRVLPVPGGPSSVTSAAPLDSAASMLWSSRRRPTKGARWLVRRFPGIDALGRFVFGYFFNGNHHDRQRRIEQVTVVVSHERGAEPELAQSSNRDIHARSLRIAPNSRARPTDGKQLVERKRPT